MSSIDFHIDQEWREVLADEGLAGLDALLACDRGVCCSWHTRGQVYRIELADGRTIFLKRDTFTATMLKDAFADLVRLDFPQPPCVKELAALNAVRALGIAAPKPIAWGQRRRLALPVSAVLITMPLAGTPISKMLNGAAEEGALRQALVSAGRIAARLCEAGLSWPDLRAKHFLVDGDTVGILDLARMRRTGQSAARDMVKQTAKFLGELRRLGGSDGDEDAFSEGLLGANARP